MYPRDAITISTTTKVAGTYTLLPATTTPYTILSGTIADLSGTKSDESFLLGNNEINTSGNVEQLTMHLVYANLDLKIRKEGNASTTFAITYVPRNRNTTLDPQREVTATSSVSTSTATSTANYTGMNFQEMLFVSCIIIGILSLSLWRFLFHKAKDI